ncbi:MAG: DUF3106 domain-containing protein [Comamonadaceae bacterium]|nr:MAG: DUF3106 domain-containing protein [Comamonadaceae bacterium]
MKASQAHGALPTQTSGALVALKQVAIAGAALLAAHSLWAQSNSAPPASVASPAALSGTPGTPATPAPSTAAPLPKTAASSGATIASKPAPAKSVARSGPSWTDLTPQQRENLKPLANHWDGISEAQKRKWIEISRAYPTLPPADQATMHSRMNEWVGLSSQQRAQARLNFAKTKELSKELTPEEKKAKWQTYQSLSAEEKQKLAAKAAPKPAGAATAVKPVAPQKLAALPGRETPAPARAASSRPQVPSALPKDPAAAPKMMP